jgi:hypothetical protein
VLLRSSSVSDEPEQKEQTGADPRMQRENGWDQRLARRELGEFNAMQEQAAAATLDSCHAQTDLTKSRAPGLVTEKAPQPDSPWPSVLPNLRSEFHHGQHREPPISDTGD